MKEQLRAWIYCRIDAPEDVHQTLKSQREELFNYAGQMGFAVTGSSEDLSNGLSFDRHGWNSFMEAATAGTVDVLLVHDVSRIGRDTCRTMACLEQLRQSGVAVYSPLQGSLSFSFQKTVQDVILRFGFRPPS